MLPRPDSMRQRPDSDSRSDPLSDVLSLLRIRDGASLRMRTGGAWALRFAAYDYLKFVAVEEGRLEVLVDGDAEPWQLAAGDVLVLHSGRAYTAGTDLALAPGDGEAHFRALAPGPDGVRWGEGERTVALAGRFTVDPAQHGTLAQVLPPELRVPAGSAAAQSLRALLELFRHEDAAAAPGARLATTNLAQLALVQALRAHAGGDGTRWLRALADPQVGAALRLLHAAPARRWTLAQLAGEAATSRSVLALRFKEMVGQAPLQYLLQWRMRLAQHALATEGCAVATLAWRLGYESESAFSAAFKRWSGTAPGRYRALNMPGADRSLT